MSVFTSRVTKTIEIPHDPGHTAVIRKLAPRHLEAAAKEAQRRAIEEVRVVGVDLLQQLRSLTADDIRKAKDEDPLITYDLETLVRKGVVSWSYGVEITEETVADLDEETLTCLAREVLKLSRPALFKTPEEKAAEEKNG